MSLTKFRWGYVGWGWALISIWLVFLQEDSYMKRKTPREKSWYDRELEWCIYKSMIAHKPLEGRERPGRIPNRFKTVNILILDF